MTLEQLNQRKVRKIYMNNIDSEIYTDISIIISMMPVEMKNKINNDFINFIENNKSENYISNINPKIPIKKQNIRKETKEMMGIIYRDYLCSNERRKELIEKENHEIKKYEEIIREKYNIDNLFKSRATKVETLENPVTMVEYKESIFTKIKNWFIRIFK